MRKTFLWALIAVLAFGLVAAGCGPKPAQPSQTTEQPKAEEQYLNLNLGDEPPQLDPQLSSDTLSFDIIRATLEGLTRPDKNGEIKPGSGLAESWTVSSDGTKYVFKLRDAKWSDGTPITAEDFEFAWKRAIDPRSASEYAYQMYYIKNAEKVNSIELPDKKKYEGKDAEYKKALEDAGKKIDEGLQTVGVKAVDPKTLEVTLERPTAFWLSLTAFPTYIPAEKAAVQKFGEKFASDADKMTFSGPFKIEKWTHSTEIVLVKNPDYWDAKSVKLSKIHFDMIKDNQTAINMYEAGDLDATGIGPKFIAAYRDKGLKQLPEAVTFYLVFNTKKPLFANAKIRHALALAVDRKLFAEKVYSGGVLPATALTPPTIHGVNGESFHQRVGDVLPVSADPAKAKEYLAAGLKELNLTEFPKDIELLGDDSDTAKKLDQAIQEFWRQNLGIEVKIKSVDFKTRLSLQRQRNFDIAFAGWGADYDDPQTFIDMWVTGGSYNDAQWSNKQYDDMVQKVKTSTNQEERMKIMADAEKLLLEESPIAPIYWRSRNFIEKPYVKDVVRMVVGPDSDYKWTSTEGRPKK